VQGGAFDGQAAFAFHIDPATGVVTVEQYLSLDHPVNPDPNDPLGLAAGSLGATVTVTDGDGDSLTSGAVDISGKFTFLDDGPTSNPVLNANATVTVDESLPSSVPGINTGAIVKADDPDLAGGLALGQANSGSAIVNASAVFGADGPAAGGGVSYSLSILNVSSGLTLTDGTAINLQNVGGVIVGVVAAGAFAGQAAFAIAIDPATGIVTVEQYLSLDHPLNPNPNDPLSFGSNVIGVTVTATDGDGDPVTSGAVDIGGQITFLDDGPTVAPTLNANATVTVDESLPSDAATLNTGAIVKGDDPDLAGGLAIGKSTSGSAIVNPNAVFGADGPAAGGGISYALSITNAASGVTLTDGSAITLQNVGGVIVGVVAAGAFAGQAAFAIAIDPATGIVTVEQYLSLDHPINPNPNDPLGLGANTVAVTVTATDGDGDAITSGAVDISGQITFLDDGPSATPALSTQAGATVDESLPSNVAAIDTGAVVKGDDPDLAGGLAIGQASTGGTVINANAVFGADGPAAGGGITYNLTVISASSGVTLTDGSAINLVLLANGNVVGVVQGGAFAGQAAFAFHIDPATGVVTLEQYLSLDHPVNPDPNDPLGLAAGSLGATVTVTDGDGDSITSSAVDISGKFTFLDDGPVAVNDIANQAGENQPVVINVVANDTFGADGVDVDNNPTVNVQLVNGTLTGTGTLVYNNNGTFTYTPGAGETGQVTFQYRIIDGDGDPSVATVTINLVADSTPIPTAQTALSDDDGLATGNPASTTGDINANLGETPAANPSEVIYNGQLVVNFGSDTPGVISFANLNNTNGVVGTENVLYTWNAGTSTLTATTVGGTRPGTVLFDIHITNSATGTYTLTQHTNILHAPGGNETSAPNVVLNYQATDSDTSTSTAGTLTITFNDDAPTVNAALNVNATVTVDESLPSNTPGINTGAIVKGDDPDLAGGLALGQATSGSAIVNPNAVFGADGPAAGGGISYALSILNVSSGLTLTDGTAINLQNVGGVIVGVVAAGAFAGQAAFAIAINPTTGVVTVEQYLSLDHPINPNPNDPLSFGSNVIGVTVTATDGDGDAVTSGAVDVGGQITFLDDGPSATPALSTQTGATVDETLPSSVAAIDTGVIVKGDDPDLAGGLAIGQASTGGTVINANAVFGADGPAAGGGVTYGLSVISASSGLTLTDGSAINLVLLANGNVVGVVQGGTFAGQAAFAFHIDPATGIVTLEQYLSLDHPVNPDPNDPLALAAGSLGATVTVTDGDGDSVTSSAVDISSKFTFLDDGPTAVSAAAITTGLSNGGGDSASANLDGGAGGNSIVADNFGADGGKVIFTAATITTLQGQSLTHNGAALEYTISGGGQVLTGYVDANNNDTVDANETVFTIQLQPGGQPNDYVVTMVQSLDTVVTTIFDDAGFDFVGGNGSWAGFTSGTIGDNINDLLLTPMFNGANSSTMNTNANEGGVGSGNSVGLNEGVRIDSISDLQAVPAPTPSGDYGTVANQNHVFGQHVNVIGLSGLFSTVNGPPGSTTNVTLIARDEAGASDTNDFVGDGAIEAITVVTITHGAVTTSVLKSGGLNQNVVVDGISYNVVFGATNATVNGIVEGTRVGAQTADGYDSLEIRNVGGQEFKIGAFAAISTSAGPLDITVPISVVDGDGDTVTSGNLAIHIDGSAPPVVLDLDGDGVEFLGQNAGVHYDYGAGLVATAWAGPDDGILVHDGNHNGTVDNASEFVFGSGSVTDLQALSAYDTNGDGQLSSADADFASFAVWQDADSDGVVDAGEMSSLMARGIASISLTTDGIGYSAANGDVNVAGTGTYTRADGTTGSLADAAFLTGGREYVGRSISGSEASTAVLAAALAAAGMAAQPAAASNGNGESNGSSPSSTVASVHNAALTPVADDGTNASVVSPLSTQPSTGAETAAAATSSSSHSSETGHSNAVTGSAPEGAAPTELLAGTEAPASSSGEQPAAATAAAVAMASAADLAGTAGGGEGSVHNAVVGQVLADALHGGGGGSLDALINSLPGSGESALSALASHGGGDVSNADMGVFAAFTAGHFGLQLAHQDAVQPHA
jgi:hypothetical protein